MPPRKKHVPLKEEKLPIKTEEKSQEEVEKAPPVQLGSFVTEEKFDSFAGSMKEALAGIQKSFEGYTGRFDDNKVKAAVSETIQQGEVLTLGETGERKIEPVSSDSHYPKEQLALDAFMEEYLHIYIYETVNPWDYEIFPISVNGMHQPMISGVEQKVKRKYVEVMARMVVSDYRQRKPNRPDPDVDILHQLITKNSKLHPFVLINPTENDKKWLDKILAEKH